MSESVFPTLAGLGFGSRRALHSTNVQTAASGREVRIAMWTYPKYEWDLPFNYLKTDTGIAQFQTLIGFFNLMHGDLTAFLYADQYDYTVTAQAIGTGNATKTAFTLVKTFGGFTEPVQAVKVDTVTPLVYLDGVLKTVTTDYTINATTGVLTFVTAPGNGVVVTATFEYYYRVRFKERMSEYQEFITNVYENKKVTLITAN